MMPQSQSSISTLLHSAGEDLFAARIGLFNLSSSLNDEHKQQILVLLNLLENTAGTMMKISTELKNLQNFEQK